MLLPELLCFFEDCLDPEPVPMGYQRNGTDGPTSFKCLCVAHP